MKKRRLWIVALISGFGVLLLTAAKPANEHVTKKTRWEHVNKTCRAHTGICDDAVNLEQLRIIENNMNDTANPCESFHNYACGNWPREHPKGTTTMRQANDQITARFVHLFETWLNSQMIQTNMDDLVAMGSNGNEHDNQKAYVERSLSQRRMNYAEIIEVPTHTSKSLSEEPMKETILPNISTWQPNKDEVLQKLLKYYKICKAEHATDRSMLRAYYDTFKSYINVQLSSYDWFETLAQMSLFGYSAHFVGLDVVQKNRTTRRIVIYSHDLDHQVILDAEMFEILSDLTKINQTTLQEHFNELEENLKQMSCHFCLSTPIGVMSPSNNVIDCDCFRNMVLTLGDLSAQLPELDWKRYLGLQLGRHIESNEIIEIINFELLKQQLSHIQKIDLELNLLYTLASFLKYIREGREVLSKHDTTSLNCMAHMRKIFYMPMTYIYERAVYSPIRRSSDSIIQQIFEKLKTQFALTIQRNRMHFSPTVQSYLQQKLKQIHMNLGNLPQNVPQSFYLDYIAPYNFNDSFHQNHLHALKVSYMQYYSKVDLSESELENVWHSFNLHQPNFPDNLESSPYYFSLSNLIVIPFTYLQTPFYDASFWPALIYGDLANTLGHELIHAFDSEFLKYDGNGNERAEPFEEISQNPNYSRNLECLRYGTEFIQERIADVSGSRLALNAFLQLDNKVMDKNGELYFLQFAQFFCGAADFETFKLEDPTHDIDRLRLDYVLGVLPAFSEVFQCPPGSKMNPLEKCEMFT